MMQRGPSRPGWPGRRSSCPADTARCITLIICQLPKSHSEAGAGPPSCAFSYCGSRWRHVSNEMERMAENGTATFSNPDDYQAGFGAANVNLIVSGGGDF